MDEPEWFDLLQETLAGLDVLSLPLPLVRTWFYIRYAGLLGHEMNLEIDTDGAPLSAETEYRYDSAERGLRRVEVNGTITGEHIKVLRLIARRPLQVLAQVGGMGAYLGECLRVAEEHASLDM